MWEASRWSHFVLMLMGNPSHALLSDQPITIHINCSRRGFIKRRGFINTLQQSVCIYGLKTSISTLFHLSVEVWIAKPNTEISFRQSRFIKITFYMLHIYSLIAFAETTMHIMLLA